MTPRRTPHTPGLSCQHTHTHTPPPRPPPLQPCAPTHSKPPHPPLHQWSRGELGQAFSGPLPSFCLCSGPCLGFSAMNSSLQYPAKLRPCDQVGPETTESQVLARFPVTKSRPGSAGKVLSTREKQEGQASAHLTLPKGLFWGQFLPGMGLGEGL